MGKRWPTTIPSLVKLPQVKGEPSREQQKAVSSRLHCNCCYSFGIPYAADMIERDDLTDEQSANLAAALREMDAKKAAESEEVVHYAPGDSPLCGEDVVGVMYAYEPETVAGCIECIDLAIADLKDRDYHQGTCMHCGEKVGANGGVEWRRVVRRPCPHCGRASW